MEPALLMEAVRTVRGRSYPLPFVRDPVATNTMLSRAIDAAFRAPLESLAVDSLVFPGRGEDPGRALTRARSATGLSRYELARQFRIMFGTSPYRYLLTHRLEFARERIHEGRPLVEPHSTPDSPIRRTSRASSGRRSD